MAQALKFFFDGEADAAVRGLWRGLAAAGVPSPQGRPHVTFAAAGSIPAATREALRAELRLLSIPALWLSTLSAADGVLMLTAVVDTELLAVHSAVHDVLATQVGFVTRSRITCPGHGCRTVFSHKTCNRTP